MNKLPCPPELWPAFSALLDEALEMPEGDRARWLDALGTEHAAVRPWVAKVITGSGTTVADEFMSAPAPNAAAFAEFDCGQQIGPYQLKKRLGSGGMGEVWLASRSDGTLNRQVALKLPHVHLLAGTLRRRFERERDILAALSHPHIAQLYDAGVADAEHPYLAMEWVDGIAINEHCSREKLSLESRLDLFLQVLDAVGYAHGRLIAHRDLKPSNIMVTRDGTVKLLDFGIAKLLAGDTEAGATQLTRVGSFIATPAYAAPEQLKGAPVTASVDLYALGVILHELLTGRHPFRNGRNESADRHDIPRASSRIEGEYANSVGGLDSSGLRRALMGDLDAIIGKALEVDPERRYRSAEAFSQDIDLHRAHRPISARHLSFAMLAWKFVQRHRLGVAMSCGLLVALVGGTAGIAWQAVRAEREAQRATVIKDFLVGVFRASDPRIAENKPRGEITARELLDISSTQVEQGFKTQAATKLELLGVTADIYRELDETKRSSALYARESELAGVYFGATDAHRIDGLLGLAFNADADGDDAKALKILEEADPLIREAGLDHSAVRARWLLIRGESLYGDPARREEVQHSLETAVGLFKSTAPNDPRYPDALIDLGVLNLERSQFARSASYYRQAIAVTTSNVQVAGDSLLAYAGLAEALKYLGDFSGAATAFAQGTAMAEHTYGRNSRHYWAIASDYARLRYERGEREPALESFDQLMHGLPAEDSEFRNANDKMEAALVMRKYGHCLATDGDAQKSIELLQRAQSLLGSSKQHPADFSFLQLDLGRAYAAAGQDAQARDAFLTALDMFKTIEAPAAQQATAHERWGRFLLSQKQLALAAQEYDETLRLSGGHITESAVYAEAGLAMAAVLEGNVSQASEFSGRAIVQLAHIEGEYDIRIEPYVWGVRAQVLRLGGNDGAAADLESRAHEARLQYFAPAGAAKL